jgi:hypothetical protein
VISLCPERSLTLYHARYSLDHALDAPDAEKGGLGGFEAGARLLSMWSRCLRVDEATQFSPVVRPSSRQLTRVSTAHDSGERSRRASFGGTYVRRTKMSEDATASTRRLFSVNRQLTGQCLPRKLQLQQTTQNRT